MERKLLLALLLSLLPLYLLFTRPALAGTTINVNSTVDVISSGDGKCTLREAIIAANTDTVSGGVAGECPAGSGTDTIIVPAGTYTLTLAGIEDNAVMGDLDITQTVTINGAGVSTIIRQEGAFGRIFEILSPAQATLTGMQIQLGNETSGFGGGGIRNQGTLILSNVLLIANQADSEGGGLKNESGASATLSDVSFAYNSAAASGGGILNIGVMTVTNATFSSNTATSNGGGILNGGTVTVTNATLISNTSVVANGGNLSNVPSARATLDKVTIAFGAAPIRGGGVHNNLGVVTISNSALYSNTTPGDGGGIWSDLNLTLANVTLSGNSAISVTAGTGGGIYAEGNITSTNVTIADNFATNSGGGIYYAAAGTAKLENTIVAYSTGSGNCGGSAITSLGHNLDSVNTCGFSVTGDITSTDPLLGPLASNGGATETHALLPGSPAIDAGTDAGCPATDQRGFARISPCDIGAFEYVVRLLLPIILK